MAALIPICDVRDPRVADYAGIRERDLTRRDGKFIVEGRVTLGVLLARSRFALESLFLCETRLEPLAKVLERVPVSVPVYVAAQGVMDAVAGFGVHRGVLACARKGPGLELQDVLGLSSSLMEPESTIAVLNQISNHDNVGAVFRNGAAFGADAVVLDSQSCDPLYRKAIRVSAGTSLWLPYHHGGTGAEHIGALKAAGYQIWAMTPRADAAMLSSLPVPGKVAILLGAEGPGLPDALIDAAISVRIPMAAGTDSVNIATAGALALSAVFNARQKI